MTDEQLCAEIRDANLGYLMLAQHLIRQNKAEALLQLGVSDESADRIAALPASCTLATRGISVSPTLRKNFEELTAVTRHKSALPPTI